jgi:hypothetical protein
MSRSWMAAEHSRRRWASPEKQMLMPGLGNDQAMGAGAFIRELAIPVMVQTPPTAQHNSALGRKVLETFRLLLDPAKR